MLCQPWRYVQGPAIEQLRRKLTMWSQRNTSLFRTGREALLALLRAINVRPGDEVIIQGYTCIVIPNAIHAAGGTPVYADIDPETLNMSIETVEPLLTPRTKAIICQHTFGIPSPTAALRKLCDARGIFLIEDCAHVFPDTLQEGGICSFGDAVILSFGRDKGISGISGGAVLTKKEEIATIVRELEHSALRMPWIDVFVLLTYPLRMAWITRPIHGRTYDRLIHWIVGKIGLIPRITTEDEKRGKMSPILYSIPNGLAYLALQSMNSRIEANAHRRMLVQFYLQAGLKHGWPLLSGVTGEDPLQKFPLFVQHASTVRKKLLEERIDLDDGWTGCVICPSSVTMSATNYYFGNDPEAERVAEEILTLPTHPTTSVYQAERASRHLTAILREI